MLTHQHYCYVTRTECVGVQGNFSRGRSRAIFDGKFISAAPDQIAAMLSTKWNFTL